jgi:putative ABC transport system permease protein
LWLEQLQQDLRFAFRSFTARRGFSTVVMTIVALGIGATTAAFTVADFVLLRPLPFPAPERLVKVWSNTPGYYRMESSPPNFRDWKEGARSFSSLGAYYTISATLQHGTEPRRVIGAAVTGEVFTALDVAPLLGRSVGVAEDQPGSPRSIVLSFAFWQAEFAGASDVVGRQVIVDQQPCVIAGVMPRWFRFPTSDTQFWQPTRFNAEDYGDSNRDNNLLQIVGRLRPGVTVAQANAEIAVLAAQTRARFPRENKDVGASVIRLSDEISGRSRVLLWALVGAATCLLLIASANLGSLMLARALSRRRELALRVALGAGRGRIARQLLTETLLLAGIGGALGIGLAALAVPLLSELVPSTLPLAATPSMDGRVLLTAVVLTLGAGLAFGSAPLLRLGDLTALRESTRVAGGGSERLRSALVAAEVGTAIVLIVTTGLLARSLVTVQHVDPGFDPNDVYTVRTELPLPDYNAVVRRQAFYERVLSELRALPQVQSAAWISYLPLSSFRGGIWPVTVAGVPIDPANQTACLRYATPGVFATLRIPLLRGRDIAPSDDQKAPFVAVVSESFARRYWPGQDPIGHRFNFAFVDREVVGVVGDVRFRGLERTSEPQVYLPSAQVPDGAIFFYAPRSLAIRVGRGSPTALAASIRAIIHRADARLPLTEEKAMTDWVVEDTATRRTQVRVLFLFAVSAIVLAAIGIHGLLSFSVAQRFQEIGIRRALGAQSRDILRLVLSRTFALTLVGAIPGMYVAFLASRSLESLLAGVRPTDATTFAGALVLCGAVAVLGSLLPARRALRIDPAVALRAE